MRWMLRNNFTLFFFGFIFVIFSGIWANSEQWTTVTVDNPFIQNFRGLDGRWVVSSRENLQKLANTYGSSVAQIKQLNADRAEESYIFVPMSREYYQKLLNAKEGRRLMRLSTRKLLWPVETPSYTSRFGRRRKAMHAGLDIACAVNTVVVAAFDGEVTRAGWFGGLGNAISIKHENGLETWYGHNRAVLLKQGEKVRQGQAIAFSGNTGRSTGPHLHFEVRYKSVPLNPEDFIQYGLFEPGLVLHEGDSEKIREQQSAMIGGTSK